MIKIKTTPVKGTLDFLPAEMELRQAAVEAIVKEYKRNGFLQVKTPILENLEILTSSDSGDNIKLMFKTIKRGEALDLTKPDLTEKDIAEEGLRYDLTVPLSRLFAGNREKLPLPFKSIQADEVFRAEKPQKGRYRQFTQCDIDIWGEPGIIAEIEVLTTVLNAYAALGVPEVVIKVNSRKILIALVKNFGFADAEVNSVCNSLDKLDKIGAAGIKEELIQKGFNENNINKLTAAINDIAANGETVLNKYGADAQEVENVAKIIKLCNQNKPKSNYSVKFDISIVRGQGYYTGTVFEAFAVGSGFSRAIGGGGRYDTMLEKFMGENIPAVGWGLGLDSTLVVLTENNIKLNRTEKLALLYTVEDNLENVLQAKTKFMNKYDVSLFKAPKNFSAFLDKLKLNGFTVRAKVGEETVTEIK